MKPLSTDRAVHFWTLKVNVRKLDTTPIWSHKFPQHFCSFICLVFSQVHTTDIWFGNIVSSAQHLNLSISLRHKLQHDRFHTKCVLCAFYEISPNLDLLCSSGHRVWRLTSRRIKCSTVTFAAGHSIQREVDMSRKILKNVPFILKYFLVAFGMPKWPNTKASLYKH